MEMNLPVIKLETRNLTKKFSATEGVADISLQVYEHELLTPVSYTHLRTVSISFRLFVQPCSYSFGSTESVPHPKPDAARFFRFRPFSEAGLRLR